ncbi:divergent polysaccharide deacetylase family protein [Aliiroseovarius crassostreae]|uniref:divergent polysaccharide deacetylase family protein n=1 Tax=Aliiroseovarius crassostreae TaxID=154981 RepID=UPI003C79F1E5
MSRGFLSGVAAGAIVSVVGLAGLSIVTSSNQDTVQMPDPAPEVTEAPLAPMDAPMQTELQAELPDAKAMQDAPPADTQADAASEAGVTKPSNGSQTDATGFDPSSTEPSAAEGASEASADGEPVGLAEEGPEPNSIESGAAPDAPEIPKENGISPDLSTADASSPDVNTAPPTAPDAGALDSTPVDVPTGPAASVDDTAPEGISPQEDDPAQMTKVETRPKLPQITPPPANGTALPGTTDPQTEPPAAKTETAGTEETPDAEADAEPRIKSEPVAPIGDLAENVTTNRLPSINTAPEGEEVDATPAGAEGSADGVAEASPLAIKRNAVAFTPVADRPLMAVLLKDDGGARERLGDISSLPFPVTFVVDAIAEDATDAIAFYRAAGAEVVVEANLPPNSTPTDAEVNFQVQSEVMRAATAVMMSGDSGFQDDAGLANQVSDILAETGHGVISHPKGLSTGHRLAIKAGVPAGLVFRDVDGAGQDGRAIRRFLDNAAFKARQQDGVIVYGRARPETLQALIEWSLGNRAQSVSVAPVSAVLLGK